MPKSPESHDQSLLPLSIGQYLIERLQDYGVGHVFGIPGDYVLSFYTMLEESPVEAVGCTREDCAGFAADAYARVHGMGALCVTYCVGGLSVCNSMAGAYAEKSPVVVITGSPGLRERIHNPLLHHMVRNLRTQYDVFEKLCVAGAELNDPITAFREIDRVLAACRRYSRPVYIEIPRDMVHVVPDAGPAYESPLAKSDPLCFARSGGRDGAADRGGSAAGADAGGRDAPFWLAGPGLEAGREGRHPDRRDHARQGGRGRDAPAVHGPLRGGAGPPGGDQVCRGERLCGDARHVHDGHQPGHLHGAARPGGLHLRHERAAADEPPPLPRRAAGGLPRRAGEPRPQAETHPAGRADRLAQEAVHAERRTHRYGSCV